MVCQLHFFVSLYVSHEEVDEMIREADVDGAGLRNSCDVTASWTCCERLVTGTGMTLAAMIVA